MAYVAVAKALYDYAAQDPETELSLKEDQLVYIIEKEDDDWWKGKLKDDAGDSEGAIGLVPAAYVEELPPSSNTRALYEYESTSPEELSMAEDQVLYVYSIEEDWLLVRPENDPSSPLGFVPRNYCDKMDESAGVAVADADEAEADLEEHRQEEADAEERRQLAEQQRLLKLKDKVETWNVSEMEGKKKNKGTLGVGNGAVFFASDTDKMSGVKQYNITELNLVSHPSSKNLELTFASVSTPLVFHCGSSDNAKAILAKLETSKAAAGEALEMTASAAVAGQSDDEGHDAGYGASPAGTPASEPKTVRWAAEETQSSAYASGGVETATVLYEFDAQGDDELTVKENETVTVIDKENDEWWSVRNSSGREGVVPAQYLQLNDGSAQPAEQGYASAQDDEDDRRHHEEEEAAAAAALEAERQRESSKKAEQRRAIEKAARERQKQEEEDRRYAEELEAKEAAKAERRARRQAEEQRSERELESARRREQARSMEPPKISKRPSAQDVHEVARSLPTRGKQAPIKPPENDRPKPTPGRTRVWSDKTGQFKVEAEYLGLNGNKIRLHKINGVIIEVPLDKMAQEDVQMIRRHEQRKARAAQDPDDQPLARSRGEPSRSRSEETKGRTEQFQPIPKEAMEQPKPRKPRFDWFAFFLESGCGIDDCTRYAANFERDRVDEEIMPELDASTLRALGLKEGDVIRVRKAINARFAKKTPEQEAQIKQDEDYARQLQEHENSGSKGPIPQPPPSLFTGANGKLANNTRRGRPEKKSTGPESIDAAALIGVSDQLSNTKISTPSPPAAPSPPPVEKEQPKSLIPGFDDDAWTIKPSATKPASPAPQATQPKAAPPSVANTTESLLAQIQSMRPQSTGVASNNTGGSASADRFAAFASAGQQQPRADSAPLQQNQTGVNGYGLGVQGSNQPMGYLNANGARGPLAPVPANQGLLNPLQPAATGFVPTRVSPNATGMMMQQTGFQPQQTGFQQQQQQQQPMMSQPTGYAQGFQSAYGGQQPQIQPNMTGYPGNYGQQSQQSSFNAIASIGPPQQASNPDKFAPTNIFAAMKKQDFGKPEEQRPQDSNKYDALRPLTTGYNGAPGMQGMMPQQTGMMPQPHQTGMGMGMGMGMGGNMMMQPTGYGQNGPMVNQMTGFNPQQMGQMPMNQTGMGGQMGYMGQQYPQGYR